ncbi:transcriptional regulator [Microbacterium esteraromaticum]|uniref:transcriptional regulator n=1 Tax=Microbacterium esteraromaticum TaxID=57043 RepID=UPI0019D3F187|nr:transcriptional regulator [Microbacterium esteraromaticum]MBN7793833.1 transcriptional regulator [Microbacterium esteraromaticum]
MLDVSVLGTVRASSNGREHPLGGARQRGLLARLVVSQGRTVTADRLIDELWGDQAPRDPGHALQAHVSRLRSAIPVPIVFSHGGYRIDPAGVRTDAARFEDLVRQGDSSIADGDLSRAADLLTGGLKLWQGEAYSGLWDLTALRAESVRLEKVRSAALADRVDLDLALGRSAAVTSELHALVEQDPLSERHWGQLISALYCDGRAKEALEVFQQARSMFADLLGVEPSTELSRLHLAILREQPPESLLRLSMMNDAGGNRNPPAPDTSVRHLTSNEPHLLAAALREGHATLLTGPSGIGKTHLLRAIRSRYANVRDAITLLTATPLSRSVPLGVFAAVVPEQTLTPTALVDHFTRHRTTAALLIDNVEQLDEASLFVLGQLIRNASVPVVLTATDLTAAPAEIEALYDSGEIAEISVVPLSDSDADELVLHTIGGTLTPSARQQIVPLSGGNPLHLREILTASVEQERLLRTPHGWDLQAAPASSARLTQLVGERFTGLDDALIDAATMVGIAGEYPAGALTTAERRMLARADVVGYSAPGWLVLSHPLDLVYLRGRCSEALWRDLSLDVLGVLRSDAARTSPAARRRAHILALELGEQIEVPATVELAAHALAAFDERLALRAATAVIELDPDNATAHQLAGSAASVLGDPDGAATHFEYAAAAASTPSERAAAALAHARHLGLRHYDAGAALDVIERALRTVDDPVEAAHLQRDALRWSTVAGHTRAIADAPGDTRDAVAVVSLITAALSGTVTGPHEGAVRTLRRLRGAPAEVIAAVPSGAELIELAEIMALSNSGDVRAARRRLLAAINEAHTDRPAALGAWEYALAFTDLLSGDVAHAHQVAVSAVAHLRWRDISGLLPAALTLVDTTARVIGQPLDAAGGEDIPPAAEGDPKVAMLRAWSAAWEAKCDGRRGDAARLLLDAAQGMLTAQHTFFAGILAHCAIRAGAVRAEAALVTDAVRVLEEANAIGGGGLLALLLRHAVAVASDDFVALGTIATEADALGLATTAADTRAMLACGRAPAEPGTAALWAVDASEATPPG